MVKLQLIIIDEAPPCALAVLRDSSMTAAYPVFPQPWVPLSKSNDAAELFGVMVGVTVADAEGVHVIVGDKVQVAVTVAVPEGPDGPAGAGLFLHPAIMACKTTNKTNKGTRTFFILISQGVILHVVYRNLYNMATFI